jgi:RimJ/RimL family protein N-acetyltransferase
VRPVPEIRTDRLLLRGWGARDRAPFAAINADPEVTRYLGGGARGRAASDALLDSIVRHWSEHGFGLWALERHDGMFVGFTGLARPTFEAPFMPAVEVGWRLARPAWGHGYATEAGRAAIRFGFETVGLDAIVSFTVPANLRSRGVMERLGMTHSAGDDFDHPKLEPGDPLRRHVLYRLRRSEWERTTRASPA